MSAISMSPEVGQIIELEMAALHSRLACREDDMRILAAEALLDKCDMVAGGLVRQIAELKTIREQLAAQLARAELPSFHDLAHETHAIGSSVVPGLRVTLFDRILQRQRDAYTFADAIEMMNCEKVSALNLQLNYHPLVSRGFQRLPFQRYSVQREHRGGWVIISHCSTYRKKELLEQIARMLKVPIRVEI